MIQVEDGCDAAGKQLYKLVCQVCGMNQADVHAQHDAAKGTRKPFGKAQFTPTSLESYNVTRLDGRVDAADYQKWLSAVMSDPIRAAAFMVDGKRPSNTNNVRWEIARRSACGIPMLNADPSDTRSALEGAVKKGRVPKGKLVKRIIVKPKTGATGARGWMERMWHVHELKYARGLVCVTDDGDETKVFPQWSDMRAAILKSGWEIIR
jgi:hypothetical protein